MEPVIGTRWVFGVEFALLDLDAATRVIAQRDPGSPFAYVVTPHAVHVVNVFRHNPRFVGGVSGAWLRTNDSRIVRALARLTSGRELPIAPGSDLTARLFASVIGPDDPITVIGGDDTLADRLRERYGLHNLALYSPPFGFSEVPAEMERCVNFIRAHPARFIFIACGAPQAEVLAARVRATPGITGIGLCIGASLLFLTGKLKRAPRVAQIFGMEWLHRLIVEPKRMWPRLIHGQLPLLAVAARYMTDPALRATHRPPERPPGGHADAPAKPKA